MGRVKQVLSYRITRIILCVIIGVVFGLLIYLGFRLYLDNMLGGR